MASKTWEFDASAGANGVSIMIPANWETYGALGNVTLECKDTTLYPGTSKTSSITIAPSYGISNVIVYDHTNKETLKPVEGERISINWIYEGKYSVYFKVEYIDMTNSNSPVVHVVSAKQFNGGSGTWTASWLVPDAPFSSDSNTGYFRISVYNSSDTLVGGGSSKTMGITITKNLINFVAPATITAGMPATFKWGTDDIPATAKVLLTITTTLEGTLPGQSQNPTDSAT